MIVPPSAKVVTFKRIELVTPHAGLDENTLLTLTECAPVSVPTLTLMVVVPCPPKICQSLGTVQTSSVGPPIGIGPTLRSDILN